MVQTPDRTVSLEEFLQLPETKPASEYIHGRIIQKPMPHGKHSKLRAAFFRALDSLEDQRIAWTLPSLRCTFGGGSIVPDLTVFTLPRIPVDADGEIANVFTIAPDWGIEILCPERNPTLVTGNILHCLNHGTQFGWLLDPEESVILTFAPNQQPRFFAAPTDVLPVPDFAQAIQLTVGQIFGWLNL